MIRNLRYLPAAIIAMATTYSVAMGQATSGDITPPPVPAEIKVPAGSTVFLKGHAIGTQNYVCLPSATGFAWKLFGPQATLFVTFKVLNIEVTQQIATHYLSANPQENGTPRPTWQSSLDTSAVWGKAIASSTDSNYVAPGAIPWLLVQVVGAQPGPSGGSLFIPAKFIHRVNTSGGVMPSAGCSQATDVGGTVLAPYTADYFFYKSTM